MFHCTLAAAGAEATSIDYSENAERWYAQSYWQDEKIPQDYRFSPNSLDKIAGSESMQVDYRVGEDKPAPVVELRRKLEPGLDLSGAEAIAIFLKQTGGTPLQPGQLLLCSTGFRKVASLSWPPASDKADPGEWQRFVFELSERRVLDKEKPGEEGSYDLSDVETLCLNFTLPDGPVEGQLLIDGIRVAKLPPPEVTVVPRDDGSYLVSTSAYEAVVGADGYLQSLNAGDTSFLTKTESGSASGFCTGELPEEEPISLSVPVREGRAGLKAGGEDASVAYDFRRDDFDMILRQGKARRGRMNFGLSSEVVACLDGRTDRPLFASGREKGAQIDTRLVTSTGGVLLAEQYVEGYSRMGTTTLPGDVWGFQFFVYGTSSRKLTLRPIATPAVCDAVGIQVECADPDFLLPGGEPVHFDLTATNYSSRTVRGTFNFEVCDYLTREPVGNHSTEMEFESGASVPVPTDVTLEKPGPYRARVTISDGEKERSIEWVFTYDFPHYEPEIRRPADFDTFWEKTLSELSKIPMDAEITPVPEVSTEEAEACKVSLATLGGRRVHCWYWKPRKPGKYPAHFEVPSSGVYPRSAEQVPRGADRVSMWMAIHGLPVDYDPEDPPEDEAAWNYWTHGIESPETSMWRTIYASLVRGVDFLSSREEVDPKRIMVAGGSQGGGLTMVLAGLDTRIAFAAPAHSGLARLDWTVLHKPGFWPFGLDAKPEGQTTEQFLNTLSYFDAANFTPEIACPVFAEVSLLDTVTASGNQMCALAHIQPGNLELICDPWRSHASSPRGQRLRSQAINRWLNGEDPVQNPVDKRTAD